MHLLKLNGRVKSAFHRKRREKKQLQRSFFFFSIVFWWPTTTACCRVFTTFLAVYEAFFFSTPKFPFSLLSISHVYANACHSASLCKASWLFLPFFFFVLHLIFMQKLSWYSNNPQAQEFLLAYTFCPGLSYFFLLVFTEKTLRGSIMWSDQRYREVGMRRCHFVVLQRMPDCCHFFFPLSTFNRYSLCGNNTRCFLERV